MKKVWLLIFTLYFYNANAQAPDYLWAKSAGDTNNDEQYHVATDANGNVFVTGYFESTTITFGTITLTNAGKTDMFLVKYDPSGNVLWAKSAGGAYFESGDGIAVDGSGNVLVTGFFRGPATFETTTLTSVSSSTDIFIAKYNTSGTLLWIKNSGSSYTDYGRGISVDANDNIYLVGSFAGTSIVFGTTTLWNAGAVNLWDFFIAKYDPSGNVIWAKSAGGSANEFGSHIASDANGDVFVTGTFGSQPGITFETITLTKTSSTSYSDIFIVKYDASGNVLWAKSAGGKTNDYAYGICTDKNGNVFLSGYFNSDTLTLQNTTLTNATKNGNSADIFVAKYSSSGVLLWTKRAGGLLSDDAHGATVDSNGSVIVTGSFSSKTIPLETTTLTNADTSGATTDILLIKYDDTGSEVWAKSTGGISNDYGYYVCNDVNDQVLVSGVFYSPVIALGTTTLINANNTGTKSDVFLAKLDQVHTGIEVSSIDSGVKIYPNPFTSQTMISFNKEQKNTTIKIMDVLGKEVRSINFSGNELIIEKGELTSGIYFIEVIPENEMIVNEKIVIQ